MKLILLALFSSATRAQGVKATPVPSLAQAQVPFTAAPLAAAAVAQIAEFDAQTPAADVHAAGVKLEETLTGAQVPALGPLSPNASAALVYTPVSGRVPTTFERSHHVSTVLPAPLVKTLAATLVTSLFAKTNETIGSHPFDGAPAHVFAPGAGDVVAALAGKADRAAWTDGKSLYFAEPAAGKLRNKLALGGNAPRQLAVSDSGTATLALIKGRSNADNLAYIEDSSPLKIVASQHEVSGIALAPDGLTAAYVDNRGTLRLWRPKESAEREFALKLSVTDHAPMAFTGSGKQLAVGVLGGVYVFDFDAGPARRHFYSIRDRWAGMSAVALSEDGQNIAAVDEDGVMHYWDLARGVEGSFRAVFSAMRGLSWSGPRGLVWVDSGGTYHSANLGDDGSVTLLRAEGGFFMRDAAVRPDLVLEAVTSHGPAVRVVRPNFPAAAKSEPPAVVKPAPAITRTAPHAFSKSAVIAALRADAAARFSIVPAERLVPTLKAWLKADLEIFRVAARVNLQRLADAGDEEALFALD